MSTKIKKVPARFKLKRRRTIQVRMEVGLHRKISQEAKREKLTLSKLIDKIGSYYLGNCAHVARYNQDKV